MATQKAWEYRGYYMATPKITLHCTALQGGSVAEWLERQI